MYTQKDLDSVNKAIMDLANGDRIVGVTLNGRTVSYAHANLQELKTLRSEIQNELDNRPRAVYVTTCKGL